MFDRYVEIVGGFYGLSDHETRFMIHEIERYHNEGILYINMLYTEDCFRKVIKTRWPEKRLRRPGKKRWNGDPVMPDYK
jgi:hypothetical protein